MSQYYYHTIITILPVKEDSHVDVEDISRLQRPSVRDPVRRDVIHLKYIFWLENIATDSDLMWRCSLDTR